MEHKQLLETLILDILNDPHSPMIQYRDSQISHICKCMGLSDLGGLNSLTFQKQFASRFIDHLYQNNEIKPLIEQASINRKSKQDPIQIKKKPNYDNDIVQIIDDDDDVSKEPRIDVEASFVKALTGGPNFSGHQFNFNNYQISKSNDHTKASSTKTEKPQESKKELKNIPELIPKKKIDTLPQNEIFRKAQQVLEKFEQKETTEKVANKIQTISKSKEKKQKERQDIIKKKKNLNENFKLDSQSESIDIRVTDSGSHREESSKKYDDAKKQKLIKKLNKEKEMQQIAKQGIKKNKLEQIKKIKGKEKLEKIKKNKKDKSEKPQKDSQGKCSEYLDKDQQEKIKQAQERREKLNKERELQERQELEKEINKVVDMELAEQAQMKRDALDLSRKQQLEKERQEQERIEKEKEMQRIEKEKTEKEKQEKERLEKERIEKERLDKEFQEKELEKQRQLNERIEKERLEKERLEKERQEREDKLRQRSEKDLEKQNQDNKQSRQRDSEAIETILEKLLCQQQDNNNNSSDTSQTRKQVEQRRPSPKNEKSKKKQEKEMKKIEKPQCRYCKYVNVKLVELSDGVNICSECFLQDINPFSKILQKIGSMEHRCTGKEGARVSTTFVIENVGNHNLEIRCVVMNKQSIYDITFPMNCTLQINGVPVREFKPLQDKSCLKKRKDVSVILNLRDLLRQHNFSRKYTFSCVEHVADQRCRKDEVGAYYQFGFYLVECQSVKQVIETYKRQDFQPITLHDSCKNEIKIDRLRVSLTCQFSLELMQVPGKGEFCQHQQCFCLNSYLEMMSKAEHRRWICPICRKVCFHLLVDKGQQFIIDRIKKLEIQVDSVTLDQNGQLDVSEEVISKIILDESITKYQDIIDKEYKAIPKMIKNDDDDELSITQNQGKNNNQAIILIDD